MTEWFEDLNGQAVRPGSRPVCKLFVVDPDRELDVDFILSMLAPDSWEQVVRTNVDSLEALAAFSGAFESKGQARKNGFSGPVFHGVEVYGTRARSFIAWNPKQPALPPNRSMSRKRLLTDAWWSFLQDMGWTHGGAR